MFALCIIGTTTSCSIDESDDILIPTYSTGDEGDDPVIPPKGGD
ncbi:hypothetical protein [Pseudotenacibaculum haliotis]|uniref:Secreted protein n=1 Tax=Pseudotenacibaculum haliotis TaxID=1862138 RepID=A0ABW5LM33_9FLAO